MDVTGNGGFRRFLTRGRVLTAAVLALGVVVFVLVWFQPQKLIQDTRVNEAPPGAAADDDAMAKGDDAMAKDDDAMAKDDDAMAKDDDAMAKEDAMTLVGEFRGIDHETTGRATLALADDGKYYVRLEDFETENGPDLFVYLSTAPATADGREYADDFIDLGRLKGNIGDQNYEVPAGTDLGRYQSVVIWCRRFTVAFGSAPLQSS